MKKRFFFRLLSGFMLVSIVPIILLGVFTMLISVRISLGRLDRQVAAIAEMSAANLASTWEDLGQRLQLFCQEPALIALFTASGKGAIGGAINGAAGEDATRQEIFRQMYLLLSGKTSGYDMHALSADGRVVISTTSLPLRYDPRVFSSWGLLRILASTETTGGYVVYPNRFCTETGAEIAVSLGCGVLNPSTGSVIGYVVIDMPSASLGELLESDSLDLPVSHAVITPEYYLVHDGLDLGEGESFLPSDLRAVIPTTPVQGLLHQVGGSRHMLASALIPEWSLVVLSGIPIGVVLENNTYIAIVTAILACIALILCLLVSSLVARSISHPVSEIVQIMGRVETGDMQARVHVGGHDEMHQLAEGLNRMIINLDRLFSENLAKQDRLRVAEIRHLQAQINPHFLYNTLDSINYLSKLGMNDQINLVVARLGTLLKSSIHSTGDVETVDDALTVIRSYLGIQQVIYPGKFEFSIDVDNHASACLVPKLIVQPIVENAIIHGMGAVTRSCMLRITGRVRQQRCTLTVYDDGAGMDAGVVAAVLGRQCAASLLDGGSAGSASGIDRAPGGSIGLANVRCRLQLYYGDAGSLAIESTVGLGTTVVVDIPFLDDAGSFAQARVGGGPR